MTKTPTRHTPVDLWFSPLAEAQTVETYKNSLSAELDASLKSDQEYMAEQEANIEKYNHQKHQQRVHHTNQVQQNAELYRVVIELPGQDLKEKFSLMLSIALIQQQDKPTLAMCLEAIAERKTDRLIPHIQALHQKHGWELGLSERSQASSLVAFEQAFAHLTHHYSATNSHISLQKDCWAFCRKFADEFDLFELHDDLKRLMHHFINPDQLDEKPVIMDGCAGIGLLSQSLEYPNHTPHTFRLETDDPLLAQIGQQLHLLNPHQDKAVLQYQIHSALNGQSLQPPGLVDVYVSHPNIPCNLKSAQREPKQAFRTINYPGLVPAFASDAVWVQYALHQLKAQGQAFVVVQDGFLRRSGYDAALREYLVKNNLLTAVISLHPKHARQTQYSQLSLLVLDKARFHPQHNKHQTDSPPHKDVYFYYLRNLPADLGMMSIFETDAPYDWAMHPWYEDTTKAFYEDQLDVGTVDFYKTAHELEKENFNLSFEHYMGYQRKTDYPNYQQVDAEFQQATKKLIEMLEKYRQPWE